MLVFANYAHFCKNAEIMLLRLALNLVNTPLSITMQQTSK